MQNRISMGKQGSVSLEIRLDDLSDPQIIALLEEHLADMRATSPPDSKHALDLDSLKSPLVKFYSLWDGDTLAGFAAYKSLSATEAEIKSMRTASAYKKLGLASLLLNHLINDARQHGYQTLSLETGSMDYFRPARCLYEKHAFDYCEPFADYVEDSNSVFMSLDL